jgi:hypothetical protein
MVTEPLRLDALFSPRRYRSESVLSVLLGYNSGAAQERRRELGLWDTTVPKGGL